jgi:peptidoglycan/LPS O-acetylase OafA/YrhL
MKSNLRYLPEIDGLRGLAIIFVLLHHADPRLLPGGYVGVDVFFAISGFLITTIIQRDLHDGVFSFRNFYARRTKRLIPAAVAMGAVTLAIGWAILLPRDYMNLGGTVAAYMAMVSNLVFWLRDGYFDAQCHYWPLLHTWSLAVEEQFYLVYPAFLVTLSRYGCPRYALLMAASVSLAWSELRCHLQGTDAYYLLPSRAWELLCGAACAYFTLPRLGGLTELLLGVAAMLMIVVPAVAVSEATSFPGIHAAFPVAGTALSLLLICRSAKAWTSLLSFAPLVATGQMSYSLYLWHWPILVFCKYPWSAAPDTCPSFIPYAAAAATVPIAWASFRYVENPCRRLRWRDPYAISAGAIASALLAAAGINVYLLRGVPSRLPEQAISFAQSISAVHPRHSEAMGIGVDEARTGPLVTLGKPWQGDSPRLVLWGDSHANALIPAFDSLAKQYGVSVACFCKAATPPLSVTSFAKRTNGNLVIDEEFAIAACDRIIAERPHTVVLAANWSGLLVNAYISHYAPGRDNMDPKALLLAAALRSTLARLESAGVKRIWICLNVPEQPFNVPRQLAMDAIWGRTLSGGASREQHTRDTAAANRSIAGCVGETVSTINLADAIYAEGNGILSADGTPLYTDSHHLSERGAQAAKSALLPIFEDLINSPE